ncbi:blood vessel epicardial substance-A isoform X1 [Biomphalaria glabrata]|nr:blood vessel epicardial substance-A isoform X1 [Biomphalaria glabrata]
MKEQLDYKALINITQEMVELVQGSTEHYGVYKNIHVNMSDLSEAGNRAVAGMPATTTAAAGASHWEACHDWMDAQHTLFQLANLCAAVSLLTPSSFRHHLLFLRCLLLISFLLFILWAGLFECMLDVLVWNCLFFAVDLVHIIILVYTNIPSRFNKSLLDLYDKKMKPLKVGRRDFAELCSHGNIIPLRKGIKYAMENVTPCGEKVSILLRGRLKVSHDGVFLHSVEPNEFVDSPEFDSIPLIGDSTEKYQVTITSSEDSLILSWCHTTLRSYLATNSFMWTVFTHLVGKDVSDKLYKIQELLLREPTDRHSPSFLTRNSSMVNVRKCLLTSDGRQSSLTNDVNLLQDTAMNNLSPAMNNLSPTMNNTAPTMNNTAPAMNNLSSEANVETCV